MNRAEFAFQFAQRAGIAPLGPSEQNELLPPDVRGHPHAGYIAALYERGIFRGTSSTSFAPDETMTRAMAATVFKRAYAVGTGSMGSSYADVPPGQWFSQPIADVTSVGLFRGVGSGNFDPMGAFTVSHLDSVMRNVNDRGLAPDLVGGVTMNTPGAPEPEAVTPDVPEPEEEVEEISQNYIDWAVEEVINTFDLRNITGQERQEIEDLVREDFLENMPEGWLLTQVEGTGAFKTRFGIAINGFKEQNPGLKVPTAAEILQFEREATVTLRRAGLPENFYDTPEELQEIMAAGIDTQVELQERIDLAYTQVEEAPLEVRAWYADIYGYNADNVLAAVVLDPDKYTETKLLEMAESAAVGGAGAVHGFTLSEQIAGRLADYGVGWDSGVQGFASIRTLMPLFQETFGEQEDYTALGEGADAEFIGGEAARKLESRRRSRLAAFSGGGGAAGDQGGIIGLGSAE